LINVTYLIKVDFIKFQIFYSSKYLFISVELFGFIKISNSDTLRKFRI